MALAWAFLSSILGNVSREAWNVAAIASYINEALPAHDGDEPLSTRGKLFVAHVSPQGNNLPFGIKKAELRLARDLPQKRK
ncbi:MAG: hypothetical protein KUA37_15915 [Desulfomicrobium sp.]|uniref:hypothetical protein n=1 Tax=Pseudodesulfovibrio sp. TaxID=2035812 RepID=UPI001EC7CBF8|nr:hypothetical protein [Pseudodesulfovibrio sp.]MBV1713470.1 hypothetical protein [Desulfomicrobium sp.]MBV1772462.1 hypothetical protein [Pseudodesulfovibrio sp.]